VVELVDTHVSGACVARHEGSSPSFGTGGKLLSLLFFMASVYILFSETLDRFYTGSCEDRSFRIEKHLNKDFTSSFTSKADDWVLFFFVDDLQYRQARLIEEHIKQMKSKRYIQNLKKYPAIIQKLIVKYA
jgi:putative endonuclease